MDEGSVDDGWTGRRVRLRSVEPGDWEVFAANDADAGASRLCWYVAPPRSVAQAQKWAQEEAAVDPSADDRGSAVEALDGAGVVGHLNIHGSQPRNGTFEYGLSLFRRAWRQGYGTDAVRVLLRYRFGERRYQRCGVTVYAFNEASLAFHRRFGFVEEGRLRRSVFAGGEYHDEVIFSMTDDEFWSSRHMR